MDSKTTEPQKQQQPQEPSPTPAPLTPFKIPTIQKPSQKTTIILVTIGVLILSGMLTYLIVAPSKKTLVAPATLLNPVKPPTPTAVKTNTTITPKTPTPTAAPTIAASTWKTYSNSTYGYSIKYPPTWTARNLGALEPLIPSYVVFNEPTATASARNITISISTRAYTAQLALGASGSATTVGGIVGTKQSFQDSDGNTSTVVTLPRTSNLLVLRAKTKYLPTFNQMLTTVQTTK